VTAEHRLAVVIDTNVWISAALSHKGAPAVLVRFVLAQAVPVFSPATFNELKSRLWKPKFDRYLSMELREQLLNDANAAAQWVDIPAAIAKVAHCRDTDDDVFIHTALAASASWLITGDQDLLVLPPMPRVQILTPAAALTLPVFASATAAP